MTYQRNFGSQFPDILIEAGSHKDIDDTVVNLIIQYNTFLQNGDMESANDLYQDNKNTLDPYMLNSAYFNYLEEELFNTGLLATTYQSTIISQEEPMEQQLTGSSWLKEY